MTNAAELSSGNTTVKDLYANTGYKFRISGVNEYGVGEASVDSGKCLLQRRFPLYQFYFCHFVYTCNFVYFLFYF